MITLINYADDAFVRKQKINSFSAKYIGKVDKIINYSPSDLDKDFVKKNKLILENRKGGGCWLWKPYIIKKTLEKITTGEFLIYIDSGLIVVRDLEELVDKLNNSGDDIMLFDFPLVEIQWTQQLVFDHLSLNTEEMKLSRQFMGGILVLKKSSSSIDFISKWLELCENPQLLINNTKIPNSSYFIAHKEDQSLLSMLAKKVGIIPYSDPTDYQNRPLTMIENGRLCNFGYKDSSYSISKEYFLLVRSQSTIFYVIKWVFRSVFRKIFR